MLTIRSAEEWENALTDSNILTAVVFTAPWCGPCQALKPHLQQIKELNIPNLQFATVDIDEHPLLTDDFGISSIPYIVFLRGKHIVDQVRGPDLGKIKEIITTHAKNL